MTLETITIPLSRPLIIGQQQHNTLRLRRPRGGDLRGIQLMPIIQMDVDACMEVAARLLVEPMAAPTDLAGLDGFDIGELCGHVHGFFVKRPAPPSLGTAPTPSSPPSAS